MNSLSSLTSVKKWQCPSLTICSQILFFFTLFLPLRTLNINIQLLLFSLNSLHSAYSCLGTEVFGTEHFTPRVAKTKSRFKKILQQGLWRHILACACSPAVCKIPQRAAHLAGAYWKKGTTVKNAPCFLTLYLIAKAPNTETALTVLLSHFANSWNV